MRPPQRRFRPLLLTGLAAKNAHRISATLAFRLEKIGIVFFTILIIAALLCAGGHSPAVRMTAYLLTIAIASVRSEFSTTTLAGGKQFRRHRIISLPDIAGKS
jgi:hypothetical protein